VADIIPRLATEVAGILDLATAAEVVIQLLATAGEVVIQLLVTAAEVAGTLRQAEAVGHRMVAEHRRTAAEAMGLTDMGGKR
jgi:hypothetical protein